MNFQKDKVFSTVNYLRINARQIDCIDLVCYCLGNEKHKLVDTLSVYQNEDGGFGNAIEPDFRVPNSSATATTIAFNYLIENRISSEFEIVRKGIEYLLSTYVQETFSWPPVCKAITAHPRAGWWDYYPAIAYEPNEPNWGNPNLHVIGILNHYANLVDSSLLSILNKKAGDWLDSNQTAEAHALMCALRYCESLTGDDQKRRYDQLAEMITPVIENDPAEWAKYKPQPIWYVRNPNSPLAERFEEALRQNIDFMISQQAKDASWQPSWEWGRFEEDWPQAKLEWAGYLTVANLKLLVDFGRIDKADLIEAIQSLLVEK